MNKLVKEAEETIRAEMEIRLCEYIVEKGGYAKSITRVQRERLMDICGDMELLATAITMADRPKWVQVILGDRIGRT